MTLTNVNHEYDSVYTWTFAQDPLNPVKTVDGQKYRPGMMAHLVSPGNGQVGRDSVRHMSFANSPDEDSILFSMDVGGVDGVVSPYKQAFAAMQPGDQTRLFKVKGHFTVQPEEQKQVVFLAGGIGITPIRALIRGHPELDWSLLHVARSGFLYERELSALDAPQVRTSRQGAEEALQEMVAVKPDAWYYMSGSERFVEGMRLKLGELGVQEDKIRTENFRGGR